MTVRGCDDLRLAVLARVLEVESEERARMWTSIRVSTELAWYVCTLSCWQSSDARTRRLTS